MIGSECQILERYIDTLLWTEEDLWILGLDLRIEHALLHRGQQVVYHLEVPPLPCLCDHTAHKQIIVIKYKSNLVFKELHIL